MNHTTRFSFLLAGPVSFLLVLFINKLPAAESARDILDSTGVQGGLIVHIGCGAGEMTAALNASDRYWVHGLATDPADVEKARATVREQGKYGVVSIGRLEGARLPYVNDLVNLVVSDDLGDVPLDEVMRVLAPGGVAYVKAGGAWQNTVKPPASDIDEWTHYLHGPDNNAVAQDTRVAMPRSIQWVSGPRWGRSHEEFASMSTAVTAGGRIFYIVDEAPLASIRFMGNWKLVARDAFNGTLLWKKPIGPWNDHLRHFRSGPTHLPRRLVAAGDKVYVTPGLAAPVTALDAATGEEIATYAGTERTEEILLSGGVLYLALGTSEAKRRGGGLAERNEPQPTDKRHIMAVAVDSGKTLWKKTFGADECLLPSTLAVQGKQLYCQSSAGVTCLDAQTGRQIWQAARATPSKRMAFSAPTLVAAGDVILCADRNAAPESAAHGTIEWGVHGWNEAGFSRGGACTLIAYAATDGQQLWSAPCSEGYNSPVDVFVVDEIVWVGTAFKGLDLKTGETARTIPTRGDKVGMPHHRCYRNKASERFIFTGWSGVEVVSLEDGWLGNNSWVRGTCQYGIIPANGFVYAPPDACACFLTVKAPGFFAMAPQRDETGHMPFPEKPVLKKGPAYGKCGSRNAAVESGVKAASNIPHSDDWPMYRRDASRGSATHAGVPDAVTKKWSAEIGGRLTQPIVAGGTVYVAATDSHTVHALAADGGKHLWQFTAEGRIDSSPTCYGGAVLFGSADGWVYCLNAADGQLAWRFRAAPAERRVCVHGQLESIWPVHGTVLVQNDTLYVTAGRSSYLDGGIVLYRINPATGEELSKTVLYHLDPETGKQLVAESGFNMDGTATDILTGDGENVYLKYFGFDRQGQRADEAVPHLFAIAGLLGEEWFVRSYWIVGSGKPGAGWGGWARAAGTFPSGRILCFDDSTVYGYGRKTVSGGPVGHRADAYHLFSQSRKPAEQKPAAAQPDRKGKKRRPSPKAPPVKWSVENPLIVRAMVLAGDRMVMAGPPDLGRKTTGILAYENEEEALSGFHGEKGVVLRIVSVQDGSEVSQCELTSMPVFDGMSTAAGKLFISLKNGTIECWGE